MNFRRIVGWMIVLAAVRLLVAAVTPVFETSEARYAAISANMARTGDFTVPRFTYDDRYQSFDGKPPLLFQCAGVCCRALGIREFAVRLPALLAMALLLGVIFLSVRCTHDTRRALLAVAFACTSVALYAQCGFCMTDGLLTAWLGGAYACHYLMLATGRRNWSLGVFVALALGMLTKGPVALALFVGPVLVDAAINRRWAQLRTVRGFVGMLIFLVISVPWFVLMQRARPDFLNYFFIHENLLRFLVHDYGDRYGAGRETFRGMALVWALVVTLPWSVALPALVGWKARLRPTFRAWADRRPVRVLEFGVLGMVTFWCLTSRVPLAYLMPIVPLAAMAAAIELPEAALGRAFRLFPTAALIAMLVLTGTLTAVKLTAPKKLPGVTAPYRHNRYSYEFYHGTPAFVKEVEKCAH